MIVMYADTFSFTANPPWLWIYGVQDTAVTKRYICSDMLRYKPPVRNVDSTARVIWVPQ